MKKNIYVLVSLLLALCLMAGCSKAQPGASGDSSGEASGSSSAAKDSLRVRVTLPFSNLDPHFHNSSVSFMVDAQVFDPLTILDDYTMDVTPCLADSWDISDDGLEYVFHLKEGVKFHNGNDFTAADVKFSYDRALGDSMVNNVINMVDKVDVVDDKTVKMTLKEPFAPFLKAIQQIYIIDEDTTNEQGEDILKNPVGTGPYRFSEWDEKSQTIHMIAYEDYHGEKAKITNLSFTSITDHTTATLALESGDIDLALMVDANAYYSLKDNANIVVDSAPTSYMFYLIFNCDNGETTNKLLRQAISHAVDREAVVMVNSDGFDKIADGFIYDEVTGYGGGVDAYEYDPEKAKALLKEAGIENLELNFISDREYVSKIAQVVQENLAEIGITLTIDQIDAAAFDDKIFGKTFEMAYWGHTIFTLDADDLYVWYHTSSGSNINYFSNAEFDRLVEEARSAEGTEREDLYRQALEIFKEEAPIVPMFFQTQFDAYAKGLKTSGIRPAGFPRYSNYSWE